MNEFIVSGGKSKKSILLQDENHAKINNNDYEYELTHITNNTYLLKLGNKIYQMTAERISNESFSIYVNGFVMDTTVRSVLQEKAIQQLEQASAGKAKNIAVKAPMPGMILKIKKTAGESVKIGESIIILEAMKMENDIHSPVNGTISSISIREGSAVEKGAILFTIE